MTTPRNYRLVRIVVLGLLLVLMTPLTAGATVDIDSDPGSPVRLSNPAIANTLFRTVFNGGDPAATEGLISADATIHTAYGEFIGPAGLQDYLDIVRREYPDAWFEITSIDIDGNTVVVHWIMATTRYVPPSSRRANAEVSGPGTTTLTIADGEIAELTQSQQATANMTINGANVNDGPME